MNPLEKCRCTRCSDYFYVRNNQTSRVKYCPECRDIVRRERQKMAYSERVRISTNAAYDSSIGGNYHISKDPDHSWADDSSFTLNEIEQMLYYGYLAVGTEFRLEPSKVSTHRVVRDGKDGLTLSCIDGTPYKRVKPYYILKNDKIEILQESL